MRKALLLAALALIAGCSKPKAPAAKLSDKLKNALVELPRTPPCDAVIPMEWPSSVPVPTGRAAGEFKIFFYPLMGDPARLKLYAPAGEAVLDLASGKASSCVKLAGPLKELSGARLTPALEKMSQAEIDRASDELSAAGERVAVLYAAKRAPTPEEAEDLKDYGRRFMELAEPALLPYYYKLDPDFWEWLRKAGAPSVPKA